jgi:hypothetical protein
LGPPLSAKNGSINVIFYIIYKFYYTLMTQFVNIARQNHYMYILKLIFRISKAMCDSGRFGGQVLERCGA